MEWGNRLQGKVDTEAKEISAEHGVSHLTWRSAAEENHGDDTKLTQTVAYRNGNSLN